ncbi:MAG TPA: hypothetical protein VLT45_04480 [Kofleriaceae bacterium]|nr:hypothetical protein [Kofleriaceae bacterium]
MPSAPTDFAGSHIVRRNGREFVVTTNRTHYAFERFRATTVRAIAHRDHPIAHGPTPDAAIDALLIESEVA